MRYSLEGVLGTHLFNHKNPGNRFTLVWSNKTGKYFTIDKEDDEEFKKPEWSEYEYTEEDLNHYGWFGKRITITLENK